MAGHLDPLIVRLVLETVSMAGDFTSFDASWRMGDRNPLGLQVPLGRNNVEDDGRDFSVFPRIKKE